MNQGAIAEVEQARKLREHDLKDTHVIQESFFDHLNKTVFIPVLGVELTRQAVKAIVFGIADQLGYVVLSGAKIRFGKLGIFKPRILPSQVRWNPKTQKKFMAPERVRIVFNPSKSTKRVFDDAGGS